MEEAAAATAAEDGAEVAGAGRVFITAALVAVEAEAVVGVIDGPLLLLLPVEGVVEAVDDDG